MTLPSGVTTMSGSDSAKLRNVLLLGKPEGGHGQCCAQHAVSTAPP
jgi:hypothetical protein